MLVRMTILKASTLYRKASDGNESSPREGREAQVFAQSAGVLLDAELEQVSLSSMLSPSSLNFSLAYAKGISRRRGRCDHRLSASEAIGAHRLLRPPACPAREAKGRDALTSSSQQPSIRANEHDVGEA